MGSNTGGMMRVADLFILAIAVAAFVHANQIDDDLEDLGEAFDSNSANKVRSLGDAVAIQGVKKIQTNDTLVAECYQNTLKEAKKHCESKTSEEQCSAKMADWYCDYSMKLNCDQGQRLPPARQMLHMGKQQMHLQRVQPHELPA